MQASELREHADMLLSAIQLVPPSHRGSLTAAAAYLRACADAMDAGPVRGAVLDYDGVSLIRHGTEHRRCIERGSRLLYPLAMPGALRLPEPMTDSEVDHYGKRALMGHLPVREMIRAVEAETMRRVKEANNG